MQVAEEKKVSELNRTEKTAIILQALHKEGYNDNQASHLLEVSRARVCQVHKKINTGVLNPLVNKAKKSVKLILEGKAVGEAAPKASDVLTAAKMVLDRADPVVNKVENTNLSISYEIKPEERERYKAALGIIDAEYEMLPAEPIKQIEGSSNGRTAGFDPANEGSIPSSSSNSGIKPVLEQPIIGVRVDEAGYNLGDNFRAINSDGLGADKVHEQGLEDEGARGESIPREDSAQG